MQKTAVSAREAQSLRIRAALLTACESLLYDKPIDAITINEIVENAGVAKGSFYNHFPDKDALASAVSISILSNVERLVKQSNENVTDPAYRIVRGMCIHMHMAVIDPRSATIMLRGHDWVKGVDQKLYKSVNDDIMQGIATDRFSPRCEDVGALQIIGVCHFSMIRILENKLAIDEVIDLAIRAFSLTLCGFGLTENEAVRITSDSAKAIIKNN